MVLHILGPESVRLCYGVTALLFSEIVAVATPSAVHYMLFQKTFKPLSCLFHKPATVFTCLKKERALAFVNA